MRKGFPKARYDPEVQRLVQPMSDKDKKSLVLRTQFGGKQEPIYVWTGTIYGGWEAYQFYRLKNIPYSFTRLDFDSREEALAWVCEQQLLRSDLTDVRRRFLIGAQSYYYSEVRAIREKAGYSRFDQNFTSIEIGRNNNVGVRTVFTYQRYAKALLMIDSKAPELFNLILSGETDLTAKYVLEISEYDGNQLSEIAERLVQKIVEGNNVSKPDARSNGLDRSFYVGYEGEKDRSVFSKPSSPSVKDMPTYDPDSVINQLSLTIPSWIRSMERAMEKTSIIDVSDEAIEKLNRALMEMRETIQVIQLWSRKD